MPQHDYFGEYLHPPTVTVPVLDALEAATEPMILREVVAATGFNTQNVHRVLSRLVDKGMVRVAGTRAVSQPASGIPHIKTRGTRMVKAYEIVRPS